jgi:hypothetical protein
MVMSANNGIIAIERNGAPVPAELVVAYLLVYDPDWVKAYTLMLDTATPLSVKTFKDKVPAHEIDPSKKIKTNRTWKLIGMFNRRVFLDISISLVSRVPILQASIFKTKRKTI